MPSLRRGVRVARILSVTFLSSLLSSIALWRQVRSTHLLRITTILSFRDAPHGVRETISRRPSLALFFFAKKYSCLGFRSKGRLWARVKHELFAKFIHADGFFLPQNHHGNVLGIGRSNGARNGIASQLFLAAAYSGKHS